MKIVWKAIEEYPDYEINRLGQIRKKKQIIYCLRMTTKEGI